MDLSFTYAVSDDVTLNVGYGDYSRQVYASISKPADNGEGYRYHAIQREEVLGIDPNTSVDCFYNTSIESLLEPIAQTLDQLGLTFSIPDEDIEQLRAEVSRPAPNAPEAKTIPLNMTDAEYLASLAIGYDPVSDDQIWSLDVVRQDLIDFATAVFATPNWEEEFPSLLVKRMVSLGSEVEIFPRDRGYDLRRGFDDRSKPALLTETEKNKVDLWVESHFGVKLSEFPELIRYGINPVDREAITFYIPYE